ncbi:hypothetical protein KIPB_008484 [Kipferlia bialata]|uniref:Uncharacterized protein n=1 Tax=Kipferlia bialata TaxID=797122 RepID=A0A391NQZ7_9EUKA|nr:hypothetical protein KIPB_008484 [Kipferlia bialata]|eukprot:g8484.t1
MSVLLLVCVFLLGTTMIPFYVVRQGIVTLKALLRRKDRTVNPISGIYTPLRVLASDIDWNVHCNNSKVA